MTMSKTCPICMGSPDRRRLVELGWNDKMDGIALAAQWDDLTAAVVLKHLKQHSEGRPSIRRVDVSPPTTARERVANLQRMQLDEIERRVALAQQEAETRNDAIIAMREQGVDGADDLKLHDWSEFFNVLDKDVQAAIGSILKTQGLTDRREKDTADLKLGLFEAMSRAGLAPKGTTPALPAGGDDD